MMTFLPLILLACDSEAPTQPAAPAPVAQPAPVAPPAPPTAPAAPAAPTSTNPNQLSGYTGTFASDPKLTPTNIAVWAPDDFRVKRNEIFARYGRAFKSKDLQAHFGATGWYTVNEGFAESMLTSNDNANVALIKSFEGDTAKTKGLKNGEYLSSNGSNLTLVDTTHAELSDQSDDMYNWTREERYWVGLGEWIITWEGSETWNPAAQSVRNARLWKLDHNNQSVKGSYELHPQQG